jgi:beta-galactosidase
LQVFPRREIEGIRLQRLRTSHNPPTPELLDACDRLGMLVMDESRLLGSDSAESEKVGRVDPPRPQSSERRHLEHRQRGVPCRTRRRARNVARTMQDYVKQLDPTRPVTYASPEGDVFRGINSVIEVRGWNYHIGRNMDAYHAAHPNQPNVGSEQASTVSTRGIYTNDRRAAT